MRSVKRNIFTVGLNRAQSIVSAILCYIVSVVAPSIQIYLEQGMIPAIEFFVPASAAYWWACYKNHNFSELSNEFQTQKDEALFSMYEDAEAELADEDWGDAEDTEEETEE